MNGPDQSGIIGADMTESEKNKILKEKSQEIWGCNEIKATYCMTCAYAHGDPPFADLPKKAYCLMYPKSTGRSKPEDVYYEGKPCKYNKRSEQST